MLERMSLKHRRSTRARRKSPQHTGYHRFPGKGILPRRAGVKRFLGLGRERSRRRSYQEQPAANPFDYEKKYPEDAYGKEFDDDARVWKVYMDEAELFDVELTDGWKDTVDVLLVFAGLFSAVVATLLGISIQVLQPDYAQITVAILLELVAVQRALASGVSAASVTPSSFNLDATSPYHVGSLG